MTPTTNPYAVLAEQAAALLASQPLAHHAAPDYQLLTVAEAAAALADAERTDVAVQAEKIANAAECFVALLREGLGRRAARRLRRPLRRGTLRRPRLRPPDRL